MENEHGKILSVLLDNELQASTSKDLLCEQKHSEDESESFSDIDDEEVEGYLVNEQEKHYRRVMWENEYQDFHEQQVAKEAAVEAAQNEVYEAILNNCLEDLLEARKRYESALAALQKFRKRSSTILRDLTGRYSDSTFAPTASSKSYSKLFC